MANPPERFCDGLLTKCRQCGVQYSRKNPVENCTNCGTSMVCGKPVVRDFSRCQNHGGPNPYRGQYGMEKELKEFPIVKLAEKYRQMREDARLLSLRPSIEVVRTRIQQLAGRIDFNEAPDRLKKLGELWKELVELEERKKTVDVVIVKDQITKEFARAREDYLAWQQMMEAMDLDRKLVEGEIKVVKEIRGILTAEDAYKLVAKMLNVILSIFPNEKEKLRQVKYEFARMIGDHPEKSDAVIDAEEEEEDERETVTNLYEG